MLKIAPAILAFLMLVATACVSGGESSIHDPMGDSSDAPAEDPSEAFSRSVRRFTQASSLQIEMSYQGAVPGEPLTAGAVMSMRKPDELYMKVERSDNEFAYGTSATFEMLLTNERLYMTDIAFQTGEMFIMDLEVGAETTFAESILLDYRDLVHSFQGEILDLGEVEEDDLTLRQFQATVDVHDFITALSDTLVQEEVLGRQLPGEVSDPDVIFEPETLVTVDIWTYPYSYVPQRIEMETEVSDPAWLDSITMSFMFSSYNEEVEIPAPPSDAVTFEEAMEEWLGDVEVYEDELDDTDRYGFQLFGPVTVTDVNGDGVVTGAGGDAIAADIELKSGSPGIAHDVLMSEGAILLTDAEQEYRVSRAEVTQVFGNGDTIIEAGEVHTLRVMLPEGAELSANETFSIEIPHGPETLLLVTRAMPPGIDGEMVLY